MILLYHKVNLESKTPFWVTVDTFNSQMAALQSYEVVSLQEYDPQNPRHAVITFDGIYENVYRYAFPILQKWGYPFELFIIGDVIGLGNEFDSPEPYARFASLEQLKEMAAHKGHIQWHTKSHKILNKFSRKEVEEEVLVPEWLKSQFNHDHFKWLAYPHGEVSEEVTGIVKNNFSGALSCVQGDDFDRYQCNRLTVHEDTKLFTATVSVIIPNYNYGHLLIDAVESVLLQTVAPDEILIIDDASTDNSREIMKLFDGKLRLVFNEHNLGTVENFKKAVALTSGDYIAFLGADNRMRCDYIEKCRAALDANPDAAVAYTDMLVFDELANIMAQQNPELLHSVGNSAIKRSGVYLWKFRDPTPAAVADIAHDNFIHGSSMYRRVDYERAGGYQSTGKPEDQDLFTRMLATGRKAVHVAFPVIEYRQHSPLQRNNLVTAQMHLMRLKRMLDETIESHNKMVLINNHLFAENKELRQALLETKKENIVLNKALSNLRAKGLS